MSAKVVGRDTTHESLNDAIDVPDDPLTTAVLAFVAKPIETLSAEEARKQPTPADAVKLVLEQQGKNTAPEPVANVETRSIAGPAGQIPVRIYWPQGSGPFAVVFYIHGGGWVIANLDTYDSSARALTNAAQAIVVSMHYRQAPEHKCPAAHDDTFAAYRWTVKNAQSLKGDPARIAVAGESACGNMAAVVSIRARDEKIATRKDLKGTASHDHRDRRHRSVAK